MATHDHDGLLDKLRTFASDPARTEFTRPNLTALLDVLTDHLDGALATSEGELEDGTLVEAQHPVAAQLSGLTAALRDLDQGLTDPVLKRIGGKKNSARPWRLKQDDDALFEALEVFQRMQNLPDLKAAAKGLAVKLQSNGYRRRGNRMKGSSLYSLYYKHRW
jgi:hypothetical protein